MAKQHLVMLAETYNPDQHSVRGMYASEKLDGMRAWWDGGVSRGLAAARVPYANITKHNRFLTPPVATGLWSRYGQPIQAPDYWLDGLPPVCLDGELWLGPGQFQQLVSIVQTKTRVSDWSQVTYLVFDTPSPLRLFDDREISCKPNIELEMSGCYDWASMIAATKGFGGLWFDASCPLPVTLAKLQNLPSSDSWKLLEQTQLPWGEFDARLEMHRMLDRALAEGGEGLVLRRPSLMWRPERMSGLLKVKPELDAEVEVIGYTWGKGRLLGLMGAACCRFNGKTFYLSGFDDAQRVLSARVEDKPGETVADGIDNPFIPRGTTVTIKYRELTLDGIPKEARFWRVRDENL